MYYLIQSHYTLLQDPVTWCDVMISHNGVTSLLGSSCERGRLQWCLGATYSFFCGDIPGSTEEKGGIQNHQHLLCIRVEPEGKHTAPTWCSPHSMCPSALLTALTLCNDITLCHKQQGGTCRANIFWNFLSFQIQEELKPAFPNHCPLTYHFQWSTYQNYHRK